MRAGSCLLVPQVAPALSFAARFSPVLARKHFRWSRESLLCLCQLCTGLPSSLSLPSDIWTLAPITLAKSGGDPFPRRAEVRVKCGYPYRRAGELSVKWLVWAGKRGSQLVTEVPLRTHPRKKDVYWKVFNCYFPHRVKAGSVLAVWGSDCKVQEPFPGPTQFFLLLANWIQSPSWASPFCPLLPATSQTTFDL